MQRSGENCSRSRSISEQALLSSVEVQSLRYFVYFHTYPQGQLSVGLHLTYYILLISSDFLICFP
jgi:hypothetical protein